MNHLQVSQPPVSAELLASASGHLLRYRIMAFTTGVVLITGTTTLIIKATGGGNLKTANAILWVGHGYLYLVYVVVTAILGFKLKWPLARIALVMAAGTIPTASFIAEHFVTRAARAAAQQPQAVVSRD